MKVQFLSFLAFLFVGWSFSQEQPNSFSLEEAIAYALEYNYSVINADREILDAQKQKWEVIATGLPQIDGTLSYQNQLKQPVTLLPGEIVGGEPGSFLPVVFGQQNQVNATATLKQQIFDGSYIGGARMANLNDSDTETLLDRIASGDPSAEGGAFGRTNEK